MKKNLKLFLLVGLVASVGLTSCSKDEETVTPGTTYGEVTTFSATLKVRNNPTLGAGTSFLATSTGTAHTVTEATANQSKIDLVLYFGSTSGDSITLAAPSDAVFANSANLNPWEQILDWTTKNATSTKRVSGVSFLTFAASANDSLISASATSMTATKLTKLKAGEIAAFSTAAGKKGMYYISSITGTDGTDREVNVIVKVQK